MAMTETAEATKPIAGTERMRLLHTMLRVRDLDASLKFYTEQLGMKLLRKRDYPSGKFTLAFVGYGDEADNTVSLYNPASGKFGPAKAMGSNAVLSDQYVNIFLRTSTVTAAGPTSPTVTLTFDIQFKNGLSGRPIAIEAAASDDFGRVQDFAFAGSLYVRDPNSPRP